MADASAETAQNADGIAQWKPEFQVFADKEKKLAGIRREYEIWRHDKTYLEEIAGRVSGYQGMEWDIEYRGGIFLAMRFNRGNGKVRIMFPQNPQKGEDLIGIMTEGGVAKDEVYKITDELHAAFAADIRLWNDD